MARHRLFITWLLFFLVVAGLVRNASCMEPTPEHAGKMSGMHAPAAAGHDDHKPAPEFDGDAVLKLSQAAIGRAIGDYTLTDREGRPVRLADYRGKPLVISLIYTSCYHICPTTTQSFASAARTARSAVGQDAFAAATIGFDVRNDTPERMRAYARQQGVANERNWTFLSADDATLTHLAEDMGFVFMPSSKGFDHLVQTTVVDADGKIYRQIYGMDFDPMTLSQALKELVFDQPSQALSVSSLVNRVRLFCTVFDPATGMYRFNYGMLFSMGAGAVFIIAFGIAVFRFGRKNFA